MILTPLDYKNSQLWIDKEAPILVGTKLIHGNINGDNHLVKIIESEEDAKAGESLRNSMRKIRTQLSATIPSPAAVYTEVLVAQSPDLQLPGVPFVDVNDITGLYTDYIDRVGRFDPVSGHDFELFKAGYLASSTKRYDNRDLRKALHDMYIFCTEDKDFKVAKITTAAINKIIKSLQPKIESVEVDEKHNPNWVDGRGTSKYVPVTTQRGNDTYLRVSKINWE